ncbi:ORF154 [Staphylococcus phage EW]|uniref:ORF154 n=1 Tax=Staphylococcus phage EW TaxID=2936814 RepID=Q4ZC26_9CAUD|nr:ORF154 [Staphylococcus phage EW]AAX91411.1 ORF154 [Staphylococcus phage EW]
MVLIIDLDCLLVVASNQSFLCNLIQKHTHCILLMFGILI